VVGPDSAAPAREQKRNMDSTRATDRDKTGVDVFAEGIYRFTRGLQYHMKKPHTAGDLSAGADRNPCQVPTGPTRRRKAQILDLWLLQVKDYFRTGYEATSRENIPGDRGMPVSAWLASDDMGSDFRRDGHAGVAVG
jgi:hypothetical protein